MALKYACERTVAGVAMTPTRRFRVASDAADAPGRTTPSTGRSYRARRSRSATAVDVLHATTSVLTSRAASSSSACAENARTSSSGRTPHDLAEDGEPADAGVEHADRSRIGHARGSRDPSRP